MNIPKYKFINFIKETKSLNNDLDGTCIREFYEELISEPPTNTCKKKLENEIQIVSKVNDESKTTPKTIITNNDRIKMEKDFLKAAQTNDLKTVEGYIESGNDINVLDSFKWSALMIAVVSQNYEIVKLLLENDADVTVEDNSGNNAYKLADKLKNEEIKDLIVRRALSVGTDDDDEQEITNETDINDNSLEYCKICDEKYVKIREKSHFSSIIHVINENKIENRSNLVNYTLKDSNKGYQMLVKSGWNELAGLGSQEQGRIYPLKVIKKYDRYGLGLDRKKKNKYKLKGVLKFEKDGKDSKTVYKSIKDFKKSNEKLKNFERKFRQYFDT
jgi:hypothetical protein